MKSHVFLPALLLFTLFPHGFLYANQNISSCEQMFQLAETLIADAEKQPATHRQVDKIKAQFEQNKQRILAMDKKTQLKSCEIALHKLNQMLK